MGIWSWSRWTVATVAGIAAATLGHAQTTYSDTNSAALNETVASCTGTPLSRTFNVTDTGTVGEIQIGVLITHTYRGDLVLTLESPSGTLVQMTSNNGGAGGDNLNVVFDDDATTGYASAPTGTTHASSAPPYENTFAPEAAFSAFDGETLAGTWTLEMCDFYNADGGTYLRSDLTVTEALPNADLSLDVTASVLNPTTGSNTVLTYTVSNAGPENVTGVEVYAALPPGLSYVSDTGGGAYNTTSGTWTVPGTITSGGSATLQITASANASGSGAVVTEITASDLPDPDSTPDNRNTVPTEDDTDTETLIINGPPPGTPPTLSCPEPTTTFDWDTETWTAGALSQSFASGVGIDFTFTGDTGFFVNNATLGGQSPVETTVLTGGLSPAEESLLVLVNYTSSSQQVVLTIDIGTPGEGVDNVQFDLFDIDINPSTANDANFIDRLRIYGYLGGVATSAILTQGTSNTVSGSTATGTAAAGSATGDGNLTISFDTPVDQIVIFYDNDPAVVPNPGQQGISIHDITYCPRGRDYSDAPAAYGAPSHLITSGFRLGSVDPDRETSAQPTAGADGDDTTGSDDEDSVTFPALTQGDSTSLNVPVSGSGGYLQAWIDWDGDNTFEAGEQIASNLTGTGSITVPISVPLSATTSQTYARLRWSSQSGLAATGDAPDGEVEDFPLTISAATALTCPSGLIHVTSPGNASSVVTAAEFSTFALGTPEAPGTTATSSNSARVRNSPSILTLDLGDFVPQGAVVDVTLARDTNSGSTDIDFSDGTSGFTTAQTFSGGSTDTLDVVSVTVPAGGAQEIRFVRTGGRVWIGGLSYSDICVEPASLNGSKTTSVYDPSSAGLFAIPGNDVIYTITVSNSGNWTADIDSVALIDAMPGNVEFYNGATPEFGGEVVGWSGTGSGLTFDPAVDVAFSDAASPPADFSACTYSPAAGYDPAVTYICFNPKGAMAFGDPDPEFSVSFRARIR